jgi:CRISPR-associated endonuclease Cas2
MVTKEVRTLVMYDIEDDRIRYRVSEACPGFGLERIQHIPRKVKSE